MNATEQSWTYTTWADLLAYWFLRKKTYIDLLEIRFNIPISVRTSCTRSQRIVHAGDRDWQKTLCMDSQRRFSWLRSTTSWQRNNTSREPDRNAYVLGLKAWHLHSQETTGELKTWRLFSFYLLNFFEPQYCQFWTPLYI